MKKGSRSRKCNRCNRIIFWLVPDQNILGVRFSRTETVRESRYIIENPDGSGHYYCMDCLKQMFPGKY